jgi:pilus assembly protein CpaB
VTRRRRAVLLAGLALLLGALAAADVANREAALRARIGAPVDVVVAARDIAPGASLRPGQLAVRALPARYAPGLAFARAQQLAGRRVAVALPRGTVITQPMVASDDPQQPAGPDLRRGERVAELVARGSPALIVPGGHVDVLVTRERGDGDGATTLALEDAEVLTTTPAPADDDKGGGERVRVSLRVTLRQAVALAAAQNFAREIRVLARGPGDRARGLQGLRVAAG